MKQKKRRIIMNNKNRNQETMDKNKSKKTTTKKNKIEITKFDDLEGKFLHIKVGTTAEPADDEQIKDIEDKIVALFNKNNINCLTFVTHHAVHMDIVERESKN